MYLESEMAEGGQWFGKDLKIVHFSERILADYANMHNMHSLYIWQEEEKEINLRWALKLKINHSSNH